MILEGVQKVFGTLDLFVSLLETEIKYPILQGGILPFWTPSTYFFQSSPPVLKNRIINIRRKPLQSFHTDK